MYIMYQLYKSLGGPRAHLGGAKVPLPPKYIPDHGIYLQRVSWYMTMYTVSFSYKGILNLECQLNIDCAAVVDDE